MPTGALVVGSGSGGDRRVFGVVIVGVQASGLRVTTHNFGGVAAAPPVPFLKREGFDSYSGIVAKGSFWARKALSYEG